MESKLDKFSKERSLSGSRRPSSNSNRAVKDKTILIEEESFNILSGRSSLNNRSGFHHQMEEEFKENTFGAKMVHEVLSGARVLSPKDTSLLQSNPFSHHTGLKDSKNPNRSKGTSPSNQRAAQPEHCIIKRWFNDLISK
jgi:hypothetical protein